MSIGSSGMILSHEQREAVEHGDGPLLIVAGAGTGKTSVITHRIAHLITSKKAAPEEILALTFTDRAAQEMEERVDVLVPYGYADITISTFHAFGDRILRQNALDIGLRPDFRVMTLPEQIIFLREHLSAFTFEYYRSLSDPLRHLDDLVRAISRTRDEDVSPEEYLRHVESLRARAGDGGEDAAERREQYAQQSDVARAFGTYQALKAEHNLIDFGDQVALCLQLFRDHPRILRRYRDRYRWILVDEFQDTNVAQFRLLKLLAEKSGNITVVGDDDQSIYRFRGAALSNILAFLDFYPGARTVVLRENYRSCQEILDAAYRLISFNNPDRLEAKHGIDKRLTSTRGPGRSPHFLHCDTVSTEADRVAEVIGKGVREGGRRPGDFAVLVRGNADAGPFLRALNMTGIPWRFSGNRGLYSQTEVKVLVSFLSTVADPLDSTSLHYLAGSDVYRLSAHDLALCSRVTRRQNVPLIEVFRDLVPRGDVPVSPEGLAAIARIVEDNAAYLALSRDLPAGQLLYRYLIGSGYLKALTESRTAGAAVRVQNIARFFEIVRAFEDISAHDRVPQFVRHLDMLMEAGDDPATAEAEADENAVNVLTVHKAKGLEFPVVFLVGLVNEKFPTKRMGDPIEIAPELIKEPLPAGDVHLQEERRLFYVGMTRAKEELYLTAARDYGGKRQKRVSVFVLEALDLPKAAPPVRRASALEAIRRSAPPAVAAEGGAAYAHGDGPLSLSHYQIDDYATCPLKYKFVHVLRVPLLSHHTVVYGKALHDAVLEYHRRKMAAAPVAAEDLLAVYAGSWRSEGFISREHEQMRFRAGQEALRRFFADQEVTGVLPTWVEKEFSVQVDGITLKGRWDRVDVRDTGAAIIDFKSSEVRDQGKADGKAKESLQLAIYALAYREIYGEMPVAERLYFLESGLVGTTVKKEKDLAKAREMIRTVAAGVRAGEFGPTPGRHCRYCPFQMICDWAER